MESAGEIGYFEGIVKEWASSEGKLDELETALIERSKLDSTLSDEDKLDLARDLRYLAVYLAGLKYNDDPEATRAIIEVYGPYTIGYVSAVVVELPFSLSQLNIKDLTSMLIKVGTKNKYPVTALASILWTFTMNGWDSDFVEWQEGELDRVRDRWEKMTNNPEYAKDFKITPPVSPQIGPDPEKPDLIPPDAERCNYVPTRGPNRGQRCNSRAVEKGYCKFCVNKKIVQRKLSQDPKLK